MNFPQLLQKTKEFAKKNSDIDDIHGYPHVKRVYRLCIDIGQELKSNLNILKITSLLHDVGRIKEDSPNENRNHAEISVEMVEIFLRQFNNLLSEKDLEQIFHCIRAHSFSNGVKPNCLEAKILSDADKLDALGAIGIYRTIGFTLQRGGNLHDVIEHLENKILTLKKKMHLPITKKMAEKRHKIIETFYKEIQKEV